MSQKAENLLDLTRRLEDHLASLQEAGITHLPAAGVERLPPPPKKQAPASPSAPVPQKATPATPSAPQNAAVAPMSNLWMQPARRRPGLDAGKPAPKTVVVISDQASLAPEALALLDKMLAAIGFLRVGEQQPWDLAEVQNHAPIALITMGDPALREVSGQTSWSVGMVGGKWSTAGDLPFMPTFSPANLLDSQNYKRQAWKDLQAVLERLQLPLPS